jgi:polysaccharide biosynthesis transport protein
MSVEPEIEPEGAKPANNLMRDPASGERLTLMEVWRVLMKQRVIILVITILSTAVSAWYAFRTSPIYESMGRIEIQPQATANVGIEQIIGQTQEGQETTELQTEVHILQSDNVLFRTAESLNLIDRIRGAAAGASKKEAIPSAPGAEMTPMQRRALINLIRGGMDVKVIQGTYLVEIRYRNSDPRLAAAIVNRLVDTYTDEGLRSKFERTMHVSNWLEGQLENLRTKASDAQQQLADYQKAHNIVGTDENSNLTMQTMEQISSSLNDAEADRIIKEAEMRDFNSLSPNLVALVGDDLTLTTLRSQLTDLQTQSAQLSVIYGPKNPKMIDLRARINKVQAHIDAEVELARRQKRDEFESAAGVEQALRKRLDNQKQEAYKLNEGAAQFAILRHQAELTRSLYDTVEMKLQEASVTAGLSAANITVVDRAVVPFIPIAPRKRLSLLFGLLGGLLGGCVLAFLIESIDDRMRTSDEVENVTMLPALAAIPHLAGVLEKRKRRAMKDGTLTAATLSHQLIALHDTKSTGAEAYRNLRSSLLLSSMDNPPRVIVVTSAYPGEGKTTTAINLAIVFAQRGDRVLLLDADLRRGRLQQLFHHSDRSFGLSTILAGPDTHREVAVPLPELPTLHILPTGPRPPNPAEMLSSIRMEEQLRQWSKDYDRVVIDSAPLLAVSDTQALAVLADTVVLVTRAAKTRRRALIRVRDLLLRINAPIAGVVVNDVDVRLENFYTDSYGMYGYRYGAYYGSSRSDRAYGYEKNDEKAD